MVKKYVHNFSRTDSGRFGESIYALFFLFVKVLGLKLKFYISFSAKLRILVIQNIILSSIRISCLIVALLADIKMCMDLYKNTPYWPDKKFPK